jgi:hypothetical protein
MPRFYFHLSAPDQDFPDNIGSEGSDLAAAHSIAVRLMKRVMMISAFADCAPDLRRWTVKVTDERRRPVFTVLFPAYFAPRGWKPVLVSGARTLLMRLDAMNAVDDKSQGRNPAAPPGAFKARVPIPVASSPTARRRVTASGRRRRKTGPPLPRSAVARGFHEGPSRTTRSTLASPRSSSFPPRAPYNYTCAIKITDQNPPVIKRFSHEIK